MLRMSDLLLIVSFLAMCYKTDFFSPDRIGSLSIFRCFLQIFGVADDFTRMLALIQKNDHFWSEKYLESLLKPCGIKGLHFFYFSQLL